MSSLADVFGSPPGGRVTVSPRAAARTGVAGATRPITSDLGAPGDSPVHGARGPLRFDIRQVAGGGAVLHRHRIRLAIIFGWYGAAHSAYLFQEIPYLISGGLLGVALVAGGGFLFFAPGSCDSSRRTGATRHVSSAPSTASTVSSPPWPRTRRAAARA